jgi:uncharacterized protein YdeI (YjbR/CyaY-like superfamily)
LKPVFFETAAAFGCWLRKHAASESELIVGFYKRGTGLPSMTWPESVDEALCHGWIDGVRSRIDDESYKIRFTPRRPGSIWSAINIERVGVLRDEGRMTEPGLQAFALRKEAKSRIYSYEQAAEATLTADELALFRRNKVAWRFFEAQPPGYRRLSVWRVVSAKRAETRRSRLAKLIEASASGIRL